MGEGSVWEKLGDDSIVVVVVLMRCLSPNGVVGRKGMVIDYRV